LLKNKSQSDSKSFKRLRKKKISSEENEDINFKARLNYLDDSVAMQGTNILK